LPHLRDPRLDELQTIETEILKAIERGDEVDAFALLLLAGRYAGGHEHLADALGIALSRALARYQDDTAADARAAWLVLFATAIRVSDDERLRQAAGWLADGLRRTWLQSTSVEEAAPCIDACLRMSQLAAAPGAPGMRALASEAIDGLERMVTGAYTPGRGMSDRFGQDVKGGRGGPRAQVRAASALLTAYEVSFRLPYSMLAEELVQLAGDFGDDFAVNCEAARVLGRLAVLHDDAEYRAAAVVVPDADYRRDGARLLASQSSRALSHGAGGSIYALALIELEFPGWYVDSSRA
jgi:hypothetical protein